MKQKALVILSGGQDSTTCLYWAIANPLFDEVHAITFDYNQRHSIELKAAATVAGMSGIEAYNWKTVVIGPVLNGTSPLVSDNNLEQYSDHNSLPGGLEKTFVPMRNQMFITLAANHAYCIGATHLVTGVCEEDFGGYPDCRRVFIDAIENACNLGTFTGEDGALPALKIHTPLMNLTKAETVDLAMDLHGCYEALAYTHTAYDGSYPPIGKDHATLLREKGFVQADMPDPLVLRAFGEGLMELPSLPNYTTAKVNAAMAIFDNGVRHVPSN